MLKIGDFSKLTRISIRMLRHYNEIGLLIPEETDGGSWLPLLQRQPAAHGRIDSGVKEYGIQPDYDKRSSDQV